MATKAIRAALIASGLLTGVMPAAADSSLCPGSLKQAHPHPFGPYNFETNSLFDLAGKISDVADPGSFKYGISSCVFNPDPKNPLYVNWLIPRLNGWVPFDGKLTSIPKLTNDQQTHQLDGCLEYGNRGDTTFGKFIGLKDDRAKADDEKNRGCRAAISSPNQQSLLQKIETIVLKFTNYVPSDAKNPHKTMLKIEGVVGIKGGGSSYTSFLSYFAVRHGASDGVAGDLKLRPFFRGISEQLLPAFTKANGTAEIPVREKADLMFAVSDVTNPTLTYAAYQILDRSNQVVGSIEFPLFVSTALR